MTLHGQKVGTLAPYEKYRSVFEYDPEWIRTGYSISPLALPLRSGLATAKITPFGGIHGIFADSLPDGWGRLLVDRMLRKSEIDPETVSPFERLSIVGSSGMGALEYIPAQTFVSASDQLSFDRMAEECQRILASEDSSDLDTLYALGGSSGGARPKALVTMNGEDWIVKFPSSGDPKNIGEVEFRYMQCARACGIAIPDVQLFPSQKCSGYFGIKRFDRERKSGTRQKIHMASVSALLDVSHRIPSLDYRTLLALTWKLTKQESEVERMFALACFNVFSHNRDDHSNNFSFICRNGSWSLSPAYDLTWSSSIGGEHATTIDGEGRNPGKKDLLRLAEKTGLPRQKALALTDQIETNVQEDLGDILEKNKQ